MAADNDERLIGEKIEACKKFSLHMAHSIRNPLSALLNIAYQMKKQLPVSDLTAELLFILEEEVYHLRLMSDELAMFARCSTRETCRADVGMLLAQLRSAFMKECALMNDKTMDIEVVDPGLTVEIDPPLLFSMLKSVIFNIMVKTEENRRVKLKARRDGNDLDLTIGVAGKVDLGIKKNGIREIVSSTERRVAVNLSMALIEYCLSQQGGALTVKDDGEDATAISIRLPISPSSPRS